MNGHIESNTEIRRGDCIQDACDPFALPRYRVSPVIVKISELVQFEGRSQTFEPARFEQRQK